MTDPDTISFDREAVNRKYAEERSKRALEGRAATRDLSVDEHFSSYRDDPFTPYVERDPIDDEIDVAIIGAGLAGVLAGADLRAAGIGRIRLVDGAGGIGGTWYWNRYPGVMCDVESYVYMPKLEEMRHVPTTRYAFGGEIRRHLDAIAQRYELVDGALFHTTVEQSEWDEERARWILSTDRGDTIRAHYLVVAPGILNLMKLPAIAGMEKFHGRSFHSARWDYGYTGGAPDDPHLDQLGDKVVGIIGTGASAIQAVPALAASAKHLYVFQRTPSAIGVRGNRPTPDDFTDGLEPGWQRRRMENFSAVMTGVPVARDLTDDGWTHHMARVSNPAISEGMSLDEIMLTAEKFDYSVMEEHRSRVSDTVRDERVAESLKPYYRYLCKRPCFHDEYLPAFNRDDVTLVDSPAGIERVTERGVVVDGEEIALDCIIYATGFEAELTPFPRRATHPIVGRGGMTIAEKFAEGPITLHGLMTAGFPNMFLMPAPGLQSVVTVNYTHLAVEGAEHIAETIAMLEQRGVRVADVTPEAEGEWTAEVVSTFLDSSSFMAACTPSRLNFEGDVSRANPPAGTYGGGLGDFFAYQKLLRDWRARGDFAGLQIEEGSEARAVSDGVGATSKGEILAAESNAADRQQVVVVTGGGAGIGAAIAEAVGRTGAYVVTVDPGVTVDGLAQDQVPTETTADRIVSAGGAARASNASVTDAAAIDALCTGLVDEFGGLDAVINVAGISRASGFAEGDEDAWASVLSVHLDGYLNVLRSALPIMTEAGRGRILGVTSGSGWRPANAGAYSCAKRAVAALTWQLGKVAPSGVTVNALSPIAATRMVTSGLRQAPTGGGGDPSQTGGLSLALASMPSPEQLGPVGAYLGSDAFSWSSGNIIFSNGSELASIAPPRLLEVARTAEVAALAHVLDTVIPAAFVPAEAAQETNGASNGRFAGVFDETAPTPGPGASAARSCLVVTDETRWESALCDALASRGVKCVGIGSGPPATDFAGAAAQLGQAARDAGGIDAVVVARAGSGSTGTGEPWQQVLAEHEGITDAIRSDVAWVRAVSDHARESGRGMRVATVTDATTSGGRSRAQAAAQLSRAAHLVAGLQADAFAIGVETGAESRYSTVGELVGYLVGVDDARDLSGAELVATAEWIGVRGHPHPETSISFGGPELPSWVDGTLRGIVNDSSARSGA